MTNVERNNGLKIFNVIFRSAFDIRHSTDL